MGEIRREGKAEIPQPGCFTDMRDPYGKQDIKMDLTS